MHWIDRLARRTAEGTSTAAQDSVVPAHPTSTPSRREFLKHAGVLGGLVWSVPVLQTVMAPAASASAGTPLGDSCNDLGSCNGGDAYCNGLVCGGVGAICPASVCAGGLQCSGRSGGSRTCGGPGAPCSGAGQCTNGNCGDFGSCGGLGASCATAAQCRTLFGINLSCRSGECSF